MSVAATARAPTPFDAATPGAVIVHCIYRRPSDAPRHWVVRRWKVWQGEQIPEPRCTKHRTLTEARRTVPHGTSCRPRDEGDDPAVYEVWL